MARRMPNTKACVSVSKVASATRESPCKLKDFYDIWMLSRTFDFEGETLAQAVQRTFENRNTPITLDPAVFDPSFEKDGDKRVQWQGFIKKAKIADAPKTFEEVVGAIRVFLEPVVISLVEHQAFRSIWNSPGPWRRSTR